MNVEVTEVEYSPLPTEEMLDFIITKQETQPNYFDKSKNVINVEFSLTTPGLDRRKVWANFGPYWPKAGATKTTKFFELVKAVDPMNAIEGQGYDSENLVGKSGQLVMVDYKSKTLEDDLLADGTPNPRAGLPIVKQKIKDIYKAKGQTGVPTKTPVTAEKVAKVAF